MTMDIADRFLFEDSTHKAKETNLGMNEPTIQKEEIEKETTKQEPRILEPLTGSLDALDELMRDRDALLTRMERGQDLIIIARAMLLCILCTTAMFGLSLGFFRGGIQMVFAAIKVPLVVLLTVAMCAPCFTAIKRALDEPYALTRDFALMLSALALSSLILMALSPLLLLAICYNMPYHQLFLAVAVLAGIGGSIGYVFFFRGVNRTVKKGHRLIWGTLFMVMAFVGSQLGWVMRPYLVRPATKHVPFVRNLEGSFQDAIQRSTDSARGIYKRRDISSPTTRRLK